ncbi:MAG: nucleotidyl transferase AbiEii/AbiGii toxin family protein [Opitutales bacterium]
MKELLLSILRDETDALRKRNRAREFLQARILLALQDHGAFVDWAFVGGTALRFLYELPRYSEDLDFSLRDSKRPARLAERLKAVRGDLEAEVYCVEIRVKERGAVASAMIKFSGLLHELGLSPHRDETFVVKIELNTNPPEGAGFTTRLVRKHYLLNLLQYDPASLLAGKLHAILVRKYTKGRDLYDLAWYLSAADWPGPNLILLNNALGQTGWGRGPLSEQTWRAEVMERLKSVNWKQAQADVAPFLERNHEVDLIAPETFTELLKR